MKCRLCLLKKILDFETQYPTAEIQGVVPAGEKMIKTEDGKRAVLTFAGDEKQYTLIETKSKIVKEAAVTIAEGEPVDLGFTIGNMTENSISWSYEGIDFMLAAKNLTSDEMIMVAKSVQETAGKIEVDGPVNKVQVYFFLVC